MRYALIIPGWFPSKVNFLAGDFIERHAKAAALYFPVKVLFVVKDNTLPFGKIRSEHQQASANYEAFIYYYSSHSSSRLFEKLCSVWLQAKCLAAGFRKIVKENGLPSLIHAHVLLKHAWFALRQSKKYNIPLLASEQWTGYLPEATGEFEKLSAFQRKTLKNVLAHAIHVTTVSAYLAQKIRERFPYKDHIVIPNLVDTGIFKPSVQDHSTTTFIHISTLSAQKNFDEMIAACIQLHQQALDYRLVVIGPHHPQYREKIIDAGLEEQIVFKTEVPQQQLAAYVAAADALVLYSNYETFGCVIVEANACGVPVIVSDFPVFNENVIEGVTGLKAPLHDPAALADRMRKIINKEHVFDKEQIIRVTKEKYSAEVVGKQFAAVYEQFAKP
jgi:glycosyltransferase involved in cell wall biosynthesis